MLTQEIIDAIKTAPETVEWRKDSSGVWHPFCFNNTSLILAINSEWRIKPKPYEAKHIIYLLHTPSPNEGGNFFEYILGKAVWGKFPVNSCNKKYEITVREVLE